MPTPPTGTVTFLFTDIEGSTQRWEQDRAAMSAALARHNSILERAIGAHGGHVFHTAGDAFGASFADAAGALAAAIDAQRALRSERWDEVAPGFAPLLVRMGIHTGLATWTDGNYVGRPLNRTARLMAAGHGGQVLVSLATQQLVRDALPAGRTLVDLGVHRLRDLEHTEHVFRLVADGYPDIDTPPDTAERLPAGGRAAVEGADADAACPYRGLHAFREADAPFFFGREAFTDLLVDAVATAPMVGVIGPSGSGKSSVVFAGLVPRLRTPPDNGSSTPTPWTVLELRPGSRPFHALAGAWLPLLVDDGASEIDRLAELNKLAEHLRAGTIAPHDVLARIGDRRPDVGRLLLVADQFEELYTLCADEAEHRSFQDILFAAAFEQRAGPPLTLALTLRADFMGHALAYRPFADAIQKHDIKLGPMNRDELARVIRMPAEAQGRAFESGLVERIVDDVGEKAGTLPLLEFALTKLWDEQHAGWLTHEAYEAIGRVEGAVARHADAVYDGLAAAEQERSRRVFVQLVQPGEGTEDTRRLATKGELGADWELARKLADARLVTTGRDDAGHETAEVVHEALIRSWGRLREWMNGDRRFRKWQERLRVALRQWEGIGHDEGALLRGAPLAEAEVWARERKEYLSVAEQSYIALSTSQRDQEVADREVHRLRELAMAKERASEQATSARRFRRLAVGMACALLVSVIASGAAWTAREQSARDERVAVARELAAAAQANLTVDPERSALLALQAMSVTQQSDGSVLPEAFTVLHQATPLLHQVRTYDLGEEVWHMNVSPDRSLVVTAGIHGTTAIWDIETGRQLHMLSGHTDTVWMSIFSPTGALLATASYDKTIRIWDINTGDLLYTLLGHTGRVFDIAFNTSGRLLATASHDHTVRLWDMATGSHIGTLAGHPDSVHSLAFSPDGTWLATLGRDRSVRIWEMVAGLDGTVRASEHHYVLSGSADQFLAFNPDGRSLATGTDDGRVDLWDVPTWRRVWTIAAHSEAMYKLAFEPNGHHLVSISSDDTAKIWDAASGTFTGSMTGHAADVTGVAYSPDGKWIATGSQDKKIVVWDAQSGRRIFTRSGQQGAAYQLHFTANNAGLLTQGHREHVVRLWDTLPDQEVSVRSMAVIANDVNLSPDGTQLALAGFGGTQAIVRNAIDWTEDITLTGHTRDMVSTIEFSLSGSHLATAGATDNTARLWDGRTGQLLAVLEGHAGSVQMASFDPFGARLVTASADKSAKVWEVPGGRLLQSLSGHEGSVLSVAFSPNGQRIATGSEDATARQWDAVTGHLVHMLATHSGAVRAVAYSPDGLRLATASSDDTLRVWDAETGQSIRSRAALMNGLFDIEFAPDGGQLVATGANGMTTAWDAETLEPVFTVGGPDSGCCRMDISRDGKLLVVSTSDAVRTYLMRLPELISLARSRLTRTFTPEECRQFLHVDACPEDIPRPAGDER